MKTFWKIYLWVWTIVFPILFGISVIYCVVNRFWIGLVVYILVYINCIYKNMNRLKEVMKPALNK